MDLMALTNANEVAARYFALIPAAGVGSRMSVDCPKQYLFLQGKPVLQHTIEAFLACDRIESVFVVVSPEDEWVDDFIASSPKWDAGRVRFLRCGGSTRRDSVLNGLHALFLECAPKDWILVHDAARPGLTPDLVCKLIEAIGPEDIGGLLALPVVDTVKKQTEEGVQTVSREGLWLAQTPQMFPYAVLTDALEKQSDVTDEASAIEAMGQVPKLVEGHLCNSKITRPDDLPLVELFMSIDTGIQKKLF